jgi:hypothetical protein
MGFPRVLEMKISTVLDLFESENYAEILMNLDQSEGNVEAIQKGAFCPVERNL